MPFVSKWLMGTTIFEIGPVLSETAAAGSHEARCNVISLHSLQSLQFHTFKVPKVLVLQPTGSNCYSKCPTTLWRGFLRRKIFLLKHKNPFFFFCFHHKRSPSLSPKTPEQQFLRNVERAFFKPDRTRKITKEKSQQKPFWFIFPLFQQSPSPVRLVQTLLFITLNLGNVARGARGSVDIREAARGNGV